MSFNAKNKPDANSKTREKDFKTREQKLKFFGPGGHFENIFEADYLLLPMNIKES